MFGIMSVASSYLSSMFLKLTKFIQQPSKCIPSSIISIPDDARPGCECEYIWIVAPTLRPFLTLIYRTLMSWRMRLIRRPKQAKPLPVNGEATLTWVVSLIGLTNMLPKTSCTPATSLLPTLKLSRMMDLSTSALLEPHL